MVLAADVRLGESVGVELLLPQSDEPTRARAIVRHQNRLECGVEFLRLSGESEESLRFWALRMGETVQHHSVTRLFATRATEQSRMQGELDQPIPLPESRKATLGRIAPVALVVLILMALAGWWRWERSWRDLESRLPQNQTTGNTGRLDVSAQVMEGLVEHRVEPVFPEGAQRLQLHGLVLLEAVIGRDGTVLDLHPKSGPALLATAAMDSVKWWRYQPYRVDGQPREVTTTILVNFPGE